MGQLSLPHILPHTWLFVPAVSGRFSFDQVFQILDLHRLAARAPVTIRFAVFFCAQDRLIRLAWCVERLLFIQGGSLSYFRPFEPSFSLFGGKGTERLEKKHLFVFVRCAEIYKLSWLR